MSRPEESGSSLDGLIARLKGGVGTPARLSMTDWSGYEKRELRDNWPAQAFDGLRTIRSSNPGEPKAIGDLTELLTTRRNLLIVVLFLPHRVYERLREMRRDPGAGRAEVDSWVGLLWLSIAAWRVVGEAQHPQGNEFAALDGDLLRPLAARLLFLVASEPMRSRQQADSSWWGGTDRHMDPDCGIAGLALGLSSWHQLAGICQLARRNWLNCLRAYESHPYLALAGPAEFEAELRALVFTDGRRGLPLSLSAANLIEAASLTPEDKAVISELTDQFFLPRFDLRSVIRLASDNGRGSKARSSEPDRRDDEASERSPGRRQRLVQIGRIVAFIAPLAAAAAVLGLTLALLLHQAAAVASACFLLIGCGIVAFGRNWSAPWLLRFPAAAAVGVIALISLSPGDWVTAPVGGWKAAVVLDAAAFGYLLVEARNHGVSGPALLLRSIAVAVAGFMYGLMVALIGLVYVAPAFANNGPVIAASWTHPSYSHAGLALWLAASWCLAIGVFSQILWDDRPITAPLAHLSWQRR